MRQEDIELILRDFYNKDKEFSYQSFPQLIEDYKQRQVLYKIIHKLLLQEKIVLIRKDKNLRGRKPLSIYKVTIRIFDRDKPMESRFNPILQNYLIRPLLNSR